jgi:RND family efflux transporter MFP subunit
VQDINATKPGNKRARGRSAAVGAAAIAGAIAISTLLFAGAAGAQSTVSTGRSYDCVIEPRALIMVGSSVDGILREVAVDRGDRVKKGQVLARLESGIERVEVEIARSRAKAEVEILSGRARLEHLGRRADRVVELYGKKVVSTESRDEAVTEKRARRTIRSPATGIIHERLMSPGEFVHEQSSVVTIAAINPLHVEVFVPITLYGTVKVGMKAEVMPVEPVGGVHTATVTVVDKVFDAASGTVGVRLELPNPALRLPAGLACTVRFATQ